MISSASQLRQKGANDLDGRWNEAALLTFIYVIFAGIFSCTVTAGTDLFVSGLGTVMSLLLIPMGWGYSMTFLANHRHEDDDPFSIGHLFDGYRDFVRIFLTLFLQAIYIFLWALLLIIPGIIKALSYAMTPFILWDLFWLYLSFIGWAFLCLFTFFIGYFWLEPYVTSTMANFYEEVKAEYEGRVFEKPAADFSESNYSKEER